MNSEIDSKINGHDRGQTFMPTKTSVPDNAPHPLDHFKRGYNERAELRERVTTGFDMSTGVKSPQPVVSQKNGNLVSDTTTHIRLESHLGDDCCKYFQVGFLNKVSHRISPLNCPPGKSPPNCPAELAPSLIFL